MIGDLAWRRGTGEEAQEPLRAGDDAVARPPTVAPSSPP